ncbi:hypothetical protein ACH5A3_40270 [Streptomyces echinatus]|uniref:hypothetical protein n=1 Tax=Streptomyces echinatus TaxID=67293 RepID=UPI00378F955C
MNAPLAAVVLGLSPLLPANRAPHRPAPDWPGTALAALGTGLLVYPLIGADLGHLPLRGWTSVAGGLLVLAAFALHQRRTARTLLELSLFTRRGFPAALVTSTAFSEEEADMIITVRAAIYSSRPTN